MQGKPIVYFEGTNPRVPGVPDSPDLSMTPQVCCCGRIHALEHALVARELLVEVVQWFERAWRRRLPCERRSRRFSKEIHLETVAAKEVACLAGSTTPTTKPELPTTRAGGKRLKAAAPAADWLSRRAACSSFARVAASVMPTSQSPSFLRFWRTQVGRSAFPRSRRCEIY